MTVSKRTLLIPAGGLGRRVGSPESKEMLPRPSHLSHAGEPLISYALNLAKKTKARAHVILRREKKNLIQYLSKTRKSQDQDIDVQEVELTREWPESLLRAQEYWSDVNVVCLPDSDFSPPSVVEDLFTALENGADTAWATFTNENYKTWGVVDRDHSGHFRHCEKPKEWTDTTCAWGLFGFRRGGGERLLTQMLESTFDHRWRDLSGSVAILKLESYVDLTRQVAREE